MRDIRPLGAGPKMGGQYMSILLCTGRPSACRSRPRIARVWAWTGGSTGEGTMPGRWVMLYSSPRRALAESDWSDVASKPNRTRPARTLRIYQETEKEEVAEEGNQW